jgi:hypothetical protein
MAGKKIVRNEKKENPLAGGLSLQKPRPPGTTPEDRNQTNPGFPRGYLSDQLIVMFFT